ncbi:MAG: hypothetical protein ACKVP5_23850 [Aestuariivirga sp.]
MTDIATTAPVTFRRPAFSSLRFPKFGIGRVLARISENYGYALNLAYVQPYHLDQGQLPVVLEGSEKGRDPSW